MWLLVTAVDREARAIEGIAGARTLVTGIGVVNAAAAVTADLIEHPDVGGVINAGIGGALPGSNLEIGSVVYGARSLHADLGIDTPEGFCTLESMGLDATSAFEPASALDRAASTVMDGATIATVSTCSGTDARAAALAARTGATVEAMEGAAVLQAAHQRAVDAIEVRSISNTTGDRSRQIWDIDAALASLAEAVRSLVTALD